MNNLLDEMESDVKTPNIKAWFFVIFPEGIGRKHVLVITASKSDSYHIFKVPAAPAPRATATSDINDLKKLISTGAINNPTTQVKITSDITPGFISWNNDLIKIKKSTSFKPCSVKFSLFSFSINFSN